MEGGGGVIEGWLLRGLGEGWGWGVDGGGVWGVVKGGIKEEWGWGMCEVRV